MTLEKVRQMHERMKRLRTPFENIWDSIDKVYRTFYIDRDGSKTKTPPIEINEDIHDTTGLDSKKVQTEGISGYLMNPASDWFHFKYENMKMNEDQKAREWLDSCEKTFRKIFPKTNFYNTNFMFIDDGQHYGTAFLLPEFDKISGFHFRTFKEYDVWIDESKGDIIDKIIIKQIMTAEDILNEYEDPPEIIKQNAETSPYTEWDVYIAIYPNKDYDEDKIGSMKFSSMHWIDGETDEESILRESGFESFPVITWRMNKVPNLAWGYGTCLEALPEVEKLNMVEQDLLHASALAVRPPMAIPMEMEDDDFDFSPSGMNYFTDPRRVPTPLSSGANYPIGKDVKEDYRQRVQNLFKVDFYRLLQTLSERAMTATQVNELANEKAATIGVMVSRLISEYLNPLFDRLFDIAFANNLLPEVPVELIEKGYTIDKIKVDYSGVLAQMQNRFTTVVNTNQMLQAIGTIVQFNPEVVDILDFDGMARDILDASTMDSKNIVPEDVVMQKRQMRQQIALQQQSAEIAKAEAEAYEKAGKAPEEGSLMEQQLG